MKTNDQRLLEEAYQKVSENAIGSFFNKLNPFKGKPESTNATPQTQTPQQKDVRTPPLTWSFMGKDKEYFDVQLLKAPEDVNHLYAEYSGNKPTVSVVYYVGINNKDKKFLAFYRERDDNEQKGYTGLIAMNLDTYNQALDAIESAVAKEKSKYAGKVVVTLGSVNTPKGIESPAERRDRGEVRRYGDYIERT